MFSKKEFLLLFVLFLGVALSICGLRLYRLYNPDAISNGDTRFELFLYERTDLNELAGKLDSLALSYDRDEFLWAGKVLGWRMFNPGRYEIESPVSHQAFLSKVGRGIQDPATVTVLPGIDITRFSATLSNQLRADSAAFRAIFTDSSNIALELNLTGEELFARMLPETYQMYWTSSVENVIKRIYSEFEQTIMHAYEEEIEGHLYSFHDIVTLASIVEWEARYNDEKPRIAGLYLNRLDRNMLLQADPTVLYALSERRRLFFRDYEIAHPYNTYLHRGIPPGPISNPDKASILAVLQPEEHDYLYMVATPEGRHRFSRTLQEHNAAAEEWREWLRNNEQQIRNND